VDRKELVDEYARLREQLKARDREIQALKMKLATAGTGRGGGASDQTEVAGTIVWTPRFEGLDRKAHAAVVDEFRNRNRGRPFTVVSTSTTDEGVSVITAVSEGLTGSLKAPEVMKKLGLRGGGRPDFAQGGGVEPGDVEALRERARDVLRDVLEKASHA
jgi:alanyl-tRNA synthetase